MNHIINDKSLVCNNQTNIFSHYIDTDGCVFSMDMFLREILKDDYDKVSDELKIDLLEKISNHINQNEEEYSNYISNQIFNIQNNIEEIKFETTLYKELYFMGKRNYKYLQIKQS